MYLNNLGLIRFEYYCVIFYCTDSEGYQFSCGINENSQTVNHPSEDYQVDQKYQNLLQKMSIAFDINGSPNPSLGKTILSVLKSGSGFYERDIYIIGLNAQEEAYAVVKHLQNSREISSYLKSLKESENVSSKS